MKRVVVTGMGAITPLGKDAKSTWENVKKGTNGIDEIKQFDTENFTVKLAAEVKDYDSLDYFDRKESKRLDKFVQFGIIAAKEAVEDSKLTDDNIDKNKFGVIFSSGIGGLKSLDTNSKKGNSRGYNKISPFFIPMAIVNLVSGHIAIKHNAKGICTSVVTACAGATNAIGEAYRNIKDGYSTAIICGGSEATINELGIGGFDVMRALNKSTDKNRASIPFDKERSGFVMGEGGAALILEELEHAKARGAKIYAEVVGYGATCDAYHITAPAEDGSGAIRCMQEAVQNIDKSEVDYINAHGTSTPLNDKTETKAIKSAFENYKDISVSSTKSMTGHLLGASGGVEAIIAINSILDSFIPATINYKVEDEECDLEITPNVGVEKNVRVALSNSLGFGGHNATVAFRKFED